jgi:hypothetical protein
MGDGMLNRGIEGRRKMDVEVWFRVLRVVWRVIFVLIKGFLMEYMRVFMSGVGGLG